MASFSSSSSSRQEHRSNILSLENGTKRQGHYLSLIGFSEVEDRFSQEEGVAGQKPRNFNGADMYSQIATFLAVKHLNERSSHVLKDLPDHMANCPDLFFTFEVRDTQYSPKTGVEQLIAATTPMEDVDDENDIGRDENDTENEPSPLNDTTRTTFDLLQPQASLEASNTTIPTTTHNDNDDNWPDDDDLWQEPFAITCCQYSSVTIPANILSGAYEIPMISGAATSAELENHGGLAKNMFARTIPTNAGDALAAMAYYSSIQVTHVANIFIKDSWGSFYNLDLQRAANHYNITLASFPYDLKNPNSMELAVKALKKSGYRYILSIFHSWEEILPILYRHGLVGKSHPEYNLIGAEEFDWLWSGFQVEEDSYIVDALDGVGVLQLHNDPHPAFEAAMNEFSSSQELQREFIDAIRDPILRKAFDHYTFPPADLSAQRYMHYDAGIAMGYAACQTPGLFSGEELYATLLDTNFQGVTGHVQLDPKTGTRRPDSVQFRLDNVVLAPLANTTNRSKNATGVPPQIRTFSNHLAAIMAGDTVTVHDPFIFADGTTIPPPPLPLVEGVEYNFIPLGAQIVGWVLASLVILISLGLAGWTYRNRATSMVKASQPIFLGQLCLGCIIMATAVFPMSLQDTPMTATNEAVESLTTTTTLDRACMSVPWLLLLGFVTSISALSCKTWRLNKLMNSANTMRRIVVAPEDSIRSFLYAMCINIGLLACWTIVSPLEYQRIPIASYDMYGRDLESYGACVTSNDKVYFFSIPLLLINIGILCLATYRSYKARNFATELSESYYLALALMSLAETLCLGVPILFVVVDNPTANYLVKSGLICIACVSILAPVFVSKLVKRNLPAAALSSRISIRASNSHRFVMSHQAFLDKRSIEQQKKSFNSRNSFSREFETGNGSHGAGVGGVVGGRGGDGAGNGVPQNPEERAEQLEYGKMKIMRKTKSLSGPGFHRA